MRNRRPVRAVLLTVMAGTFMSMAASGEWVNAESGLNLRAQANTKAQVMDIIPFGTQLEVTRTVGIAADVWADVEYNGKRGYCKMEYLSKTDPLEGMSYMGEWQITAYAYTGSKTASGTFPTIDYTVACNSLEIGTRIYIDGVGFRVVEDRGPSWMEDTWCDLYLGNTEECIQWGSQNRKVWIEGK